MPFYDGAKEGPFMLQLRKWSQLPFQIKPSKFHEAFISPSKELLLLLSHECEAQLLPLNGDPALLQFPVICDVRSLAWGSFGDSYRQHEAFCFREILVVSSDCDIVVHLFRCLDTNSELVNPSSEDEVVQGKWVEWGPHGRKLVDLSSPDYYGLVYAKEEHGISLFDEDIHHDDLSSDSFVRDPSFMPKNLLHTFFIEPEIFTSETEYLVRVPINSRFPSSVKVLSFSIFDSTMMFMDFLSHNGSSFTTQDQLGERISGGCASHVEEHSPRQHVKPPLSKISSLKTSFTYGSHGETSCKCSRVFGGSSHRFIGLVFSWLDSISNQNEKGANIKIFVIVVMVHSWGIQWLCCVDFECLGKDQSIQRNWVDFQFSDNFLVCLNSSGLVCIWDAKVGDSVVQIDTLKSCGLYSTINDIDYLRSFREDNPSCTTVRCHGTKQENGVRERGKDANYGITAKRSFRRLVIASSFRLLAVIDDLGIMYIICVQEHLPRKYKSPEPTFCYQTFLSGWKVAGNGIGNKRAFSDAFNNCDLLLNENGSTNKGWSELARRMKGKVHIPGSDNKINTCANGFPVLPSHHDRPATMRKVLLPINVQSKNDCIGFSPLGLTRLVRNFSESKHKVVHTYLHVTSVLEGDFIRNKQLQNHVYFEQECTFSSEAIGCCLKGFLYLVTEEGLFVVIPTLSLPSDSSAVESIRYWLPSTVCGVRREEEHLEKSRWQLLGSPWQTEIIDRVILYEGPEDAEAICLANGWELKIARVRRMQLALYYSRYEEIERSLEMLADVKLAEEGILWLIFASVYRITCLHGGDDGGALVTRFLSLATRFATKMIRKYGLHEFEQDNDHDSDSNGLGTSHLLQHVPESKRVNPGKLQEMALFLECVRTIQSKLGMSSSSEANGGGDSSVILEMKFSQVVPSHSGGATVSLDASSIISKSYCPENNLELLPVEFPVTGETGNADILKESISRENPKDMITRWVVDNLDIRAVVRDALLADRLPLAVLQLHFCHLKELGAGEDPSDTFSIVRDVGRTISYNMFLEGEIELAIMTLQRLGEDVESSLRQLLFGTLRRPIRKQIADAMNKLGYLKSHEIRTLDRLSLIERSYPHNGFWDTYKRKHAEDTPSIDTDIIRPSIHLEAWDNFSLECGNADGAVLEPWANISDETPVPEPDANEDDDSFGYWVCAAVWSDAWNQCTIDRMILDQCHLSEVTFSWESQLEYHICHNDWREVDKLLDDIQTMALDEGFLRINIEISHTNEDVLCNNNALANSNLICSPEELDSVFYEINNIRILRLSDFTVCSSWLKMLIEQKLASEFIFLKDYWESTSEIVSILARSGFILRSSPEYSVSPNGSVDLHLSRAIDYSDQDISASFHKLVLYYCVQYHLPVLMELYLDHHKVAVDMNSLSSLQELVGDCEWANWLLLTRVKGCEYDASFANARCIFSKNTISGSNLSVLESDEMLLTVDDMAEGGGELAALATLMYAPLPIQKCLCKGSVSRHGGASFQCTLENLKYGLQRFPTLWNTLVTSSFGQDQDCYLSNPGINNAFVRPTSSDYLVWRDTIFSSVGGDTSLIQMLPCWFSKSIRRLVKIFVQGPPGWQSISRTVSSEESLLHRRAGLSGLDGGSGLNAVSWEMAIQRSIEKLYSSVQDKTLGIEHHLHRGRALAAFNLLFSSRNLELKSKHPYQVTSGGPIPGQSNFQSDIHTLLGPLTPSEQSQLSSVVPLAIMHFEDSVLVASCAFLLELCGLSANMLRLDVAVLERISSYYKSSEPSSPFGHVSPKCSRVNSIPTEDFIISLARAMADDYVHQTFKRSGPKDSFRTETHEPPLLNLRNVLQHLEKASLPSLIDGSTCGSWLSSGIGDGIELRSQQKAASHYWHLVTIFCQMHHLPLSTKYLAILAKDNDWVGFLTEAQVTGFSIDSVIKVADKEFGDPRLKMHILTLLKSIQSMKKEVGLEGSGPIGLADEKHFTGSTDTNPVELFGLVSECERKKNPGEALLLKAKDLRWSLLALVASCFPDVSSLSCLTIWLEITVARETSSIKINDIYSKIASNVGAAVEVTNALPVSNRTLQFHYNRKNPKRRHMPDDSGGETRKCKSLASSGSLELGGIHFIADFPHQTDGIVEVTVLTSFSDTEERLANLSNMISVLCEQHLFLPLLRAFEMFLPSSPLLSFIRSLQAFVQMRLSEASAHLATFSSTNREPSTYVNSNKQGHFSLNWISSTSVKAANAVLSTCPSTYEKRCLLLLLSSVDFRDGGSAASFFQRLYWKINLAEPLFRKGGDLPLGAENLDDASLLAALEKSGQWEDARTWARQLDSNDAPWKPSAHHVTEMQAEAMVAEWKEFLWDVPEERAAIWSHCQTLFIRHSFAPLQAGKFFLKHADAIEKDIPARELHELLLFSLQWLSGFITQSNPVFPLHLLRDIETRVWLLAVESEAQCEAERDFISHGSPLNSSRNNTNIIEQTANIISKMDNHINTMLMRSCGRNGTREAYQLNRLPVSDTGTTSSAGTRAKRRSKVYLPQRRSLSDIADNNSDNEESFILPESYKAIGEISETLQVQDENDKADTAFLGWDERLQPAQFERAILSLLEFGQIQAARQLQQKLSPTTVPSELNIIDVALRLASVSSSNSSEISMSMLDPDLHSLISSYNPTNYNQVDQLQMLELLALKCREGCGRGLCKRIIAVLKASRSICIPFPEAFEKRPIELLQLLSLKAQECFDEAKLLVQSHVMPPASVACILAESFLKGLLAAHRGGYMDSQKEEGPAPLLWRFSDFLKWAELCTSESEIGHALTRLVMTSQEIPHACEVELLILAHHFYKSSFCLGGVDVLVTLAANRVESYVLEEEFPCLARLVTGVGNFHSLSFILNILIENGQLELLLQKYSSEEVVTDRSETVRGFRMAVLTALKHFDPHDLDSVAKVYNHFDMKHETASLLESRSKLSLQKWNRRRNKHQVNEDLLESMEYLIEAADVYATIDAGQKTHRACAQAYLVSLQVRIPDFCWLGLTETNSRRLFSEQSRFQEALIVAEAYGLNKPSEWAPMLWNLMLRSDLIEQFISEFVSVLPLQPSMLTELARYYRNEVAARGERSHFAWLTSKSFRSLLKKTRDLRVRMQLATTATGFGDVINSCAKVLDKVPDNSGPLILRRGHGGAYLPLM